MANITKTTADAIRKTAARVNKADETIALDVDNLTLEGLAYLVQYGFKQSLNDSVASTDKGATKEAADLAHKRHTAILRGEVGSGGGGQSPLSKQVRAVLGERIAGWKDFSAKAKRQTIEKIISGDGNEAAQAILTEAKRRTEQNDKLDASDILD